MAYIQLTEGNELPDISEFAPFKMVIVIEDLVSTERQVQIANWLVEMGGLYVMTCGENSTSWIDPIRQAKIEKSNIQSISPDEFLIKLLKLYP